MLGLVKGLGEQGGQAGGPEGLICGCCDQIIAQFNEFVVAVAADGVSVNGIIV